MAGRPKKRARERGAADPTAPPPAPRPSASGMPASGRPPRRDGMATMVSGYRSPRVHAALGNKLTEGLLAEQPDLARYPEQLAAWSRCESRALLLQRHLATVGVADDKGELRVRLLQQLANAERLAGEARRALGLTPLSEAQIARERASAAVLGLDLAQVAAQGQAALASNPRLQVVHGDPAGDARDLVLDEFDAREASAVEAWHAARGTS